jgi:hypothetical protein
MTDTDTEQPTHRETRAERTARLAAERAAGQGGDGTEPTPPDFDRLATLNPAADDLSDEDRSALAALDEKQTAKVAEMRAELLAIAGVEGFDVTETHDLRVATTPVRNRKPVQKAMDKVALKAYQDWVAAGRPSTWSRMPVITYFIDPGIEDGHGSVSDYRGWIRKAAQVIPPEPYEKDGKTITPSGVRIRFGGDFVLNDKMAAKIGKPEQAGMSVLAWAAVDKRITSGNGNPDSDE